jgi:hypothetical protein
MIRELVGALGFAIALALTFSSCNLIGALVGAF